MTKKICTILGARPQFIKASPLSNEIRKHFHEIIVHTGQHYDHDMSDIFFEELEIPKPDYHLNVGSGTHGKQTGAMLDKIEQVLLKENPDMVLVYGDTNSTLAGALAAAKMHIPIAHVEAGLRSFDRQMPEEINRILTDSISSWLFTPSQNAVQLLKNEGITKGVYDVGDIMFDAVLTFSQKATSTSAILQTLDIKKQSYLLATIHRQENTDEEKNLKSIIAAFEQINEKIILPIHPRTKSKMTQMGLMFSPNVCTINPLGYLDMIQLLANAQAVFTDSGGLQKEAYYLKVPCITLRTTSEWTETLDTGWNVLVGTETEKIVDAYGSISTIGQKKYINLYGDGNTASRIAEVLLRTS